MIKSIIFIVLILFIISLLSKKGFEHFEKNPHIAEIQFPVGPTGPDRNPIETIGTPIAVVTSTSSSSSSSSSTSSLSTTTQPPGVV